MSGVYRQLIEATISHLEFLKQKGVRYVEVSPESVNSLFESAPHEAVSSNGKRLIQTQPVIQSIRSEGPNVYEAKKLSSVDKSSALNDLRNEILASKKSPEILASGANLVFGIGSVDEALRFVG